MVKPKPYFFNPVTYRINLADKELKKIKERRAGIIAMVKVISVGITVGKSLPQDQEGYISEEDANVVLDLLNKLISKFSSDVGKLESEVAELKKIKKAKKHE